MRYQVNKRDFLESLILTAVILFVTFFTCDTVLFGTNKNKLYSNSIQAVLDINQFYGKKRKEEEAALKNISISKFMMYKHG